MFPQRVELWSGSNYRNHPQRRVKQRGQQVQQRSLSKYRNGISSTQAEALAKVSRMRARSRHCVRRQIVCKATHPDEDVLEHRLRYHLGPSAGPRWSGPEEPGAPSPSAWLERRNVGIERNNEQPKSYPIYWWVPTDRPNLRLGSRKGTYCPKWEV